MIPVTSVTGRRECKSWTRPHSVWRIVGLLFWSRSRELTRLLVLSGKGLENQREAAERAEGLRHVFGELADMSARRAAEELNRRGFAAPAGGNWFAVQVIRIRKRLGP